MFPTRYLNLGEVALCRLSHSRSLGANLIQGLGQTLRVGHNDWVPLPRVARSSPSSSGLDAFRKSR